MSEIIAGRKPVLEALKNRERVEKLYFRQGEHKGSLIEILAKAKEAGIPVQSCSSEKLEELSGGARHQGVALLRSETEYLSLDALFEIAEARGEAPFFLLLDGIMDPHNLGAMIRTAEVCGCHGVILPKRNSAPVTAVVHKAAAGATEHIG